MMRIMTYIYPSCGRVPVRRPSIAPYPIVGGGRALCTIGIMGDGLSCALGGGPIAVGRRRWGSGRGGGLTDGSGGSWAGGGKTMIWSAYAAACGGRSEKKVIKNPKKNR